MNIKVYSNKSKNIVSIYEWEKRPILLKIIPFLSLFYRKTLWYIFAFASESIIQTTIANGFKNNPKRAEQHILKYINSILKFLPDSSNHIEIIIFQYDHKNNKIKFNSWEKRLTISANLTFLKNKNLRFNYLPVKHVNIIKNSNFESKAISFNSTYFSKKSTTT